MPIVVDHIRIDEDSPVFFQAADFVMYDCPRDYDAIFLTGKAGKDSGMFYWERDRNYIVSICHKSIFLCTLLKEE